MIVGMAQTRPRGSSEKGAQCSLESPRQLFDSTGRTVPGEGGGEGLGGGDRDDDVFEPNGGGQALCPIGYGREESN